MGRSASDACSRQPINRSYDHNDRPVTAAWKLFLTRIIFYDGMNCFHTYLRLLKTGEPGTTWNIDQKQTLRRGQVKGGAA